VALELRAMQVIQEAGLLEDTLKNCQTQVCHVTCCVDAQRGAILVRARLKTTIQRFGSQNGSWPLSQGPEWSRGKECNVIGLDNRMALRRVVRIVLAT
jgi:hypothetical protein